MAWIKNIGDRPREVKCYYKGKLTDRIIAIGEVVEIHDADRDMYILSLPMAIKIVDKPNPIYLNPRTIGIGCTILGYILGKFF